MSAHEASRRKAIIATTALTDVERVCELIDVTAFVFVMAAFLLSECALTARAADRASAQKPSLPNRFIFSTSEIVFEPQRRTAIKSRSREKEGV